jgi:glycosyltransferase involved in cell wall biosynthesis
MSLVEAMSLQVPVIASRVGGMIQVVGDSESGILFESGNVEELAQAITTLLKNKELNIEMGLKGRKRAEEVFSWDIIASDLLEEYKKLYN